MPPPQVFTKRTHSDLRSLHCLLFKPPKMRNEANGRELRVDCQAILQPLQFIIMKRILSLLLIFAGGVVRVVWGEMGVIQLREGEVASRFTSASGARALPFSIRFERLHVETEAAPRDTAAAQTLSRCARSPSDSCRTVSPDCAWTSASHRAASIREHVHLPTVPRAARDRAGASVPGRAERPLTCAGSPRR